VPRAQPRDRLLEEPTRPDLGTFASNFKTYKSRLPASIWMIFIGWVPLRSPTSKTGARPPHPHAKWPRPGPRCQSGSSWPSRPKRSAAEARYSPSSSTITPFPYPNPAPSAGQIGGDAKRTFTDHQMLTEKPTQFPETAYAQADLKRLNEGISLTKKEAKNGDGS
jgi:hypothetical protein